MAGGTADWAVGSDGQGSGAQPATPPSPAESAFAAEALASSISTAARYCMSAAARLTVYPPPAVYSTAKMFATATAVPEGTTAVAITAAVTATFIAA